jgi:HK97 family phage major capsid protein
MKTTIEGLRTKRNGLIEKTRAALDDPNITAAALQTVQRMQDDIDSLEGEINTLERTAGYITKGAESAGRLAPANAGDGDAARSNSNEFRDLHGNAVRMASHGESLARNHSELHIGRLVRGMITGSWRDAENEQRAMAIGTDIEGGYLIDAGMSDRLIDLSRSAMTVSQAGAQTVMMDTNELVMVRVTGDPTVGWYGEGQTIANSDPTLGQLKFTARKMAAMITVSRELVEDASNMPSVIEDLLAKAVAAEVDRVALLGDGASSSEPVGIFNQDGIQTEGSVGSPTYDDFLNAAYNIQSVNGTPGAVILNPDTANTLRQLKDTAGQYLAPPKGFTDLKQLQTTVLATSQAVVGDFSKLLLGVRENMRLEVSKDAAFATDQVQIKIVWRGDVQLGGKANHFSTLEGIS